MPRYLFILLLVGCGTTATQRYTYDVSMIRQASESKQAALDDMNAEGRDLEPFETKLKSFGSVEFLARKKPTVKDQESRITAEVAISKEKPARCVIETHAERSMATLASLRSGYREASGRYELKFDRTITESGQRFRVVHEVYSNEGEITFVKYASARVGSGSAVCIHEGYGFRETLDRMFAHLMKTARGPASE